jgi:hypothetical protein
MFFMVLALELSNPKEVTPPILSQIGIILTVLTENVDTLGHATAGGSVR